MNKIIEAKFVIIKKEHKCSICEILCYPGNKMFFQKLIVGGRAIKNFYSVYYCCEACKIVLDMNSFNVTNTSLRRVDFKLRKTLMKTSTNEYLSYLSIIEQL